MTATTQHSRMGIPLSGGYGSAMAAEEALTRLLPDTRRDITIYYEQLLAGVEAKSLSRRHGLHRRCRILDSDRLGCVSSLGIAEF
jgi:hypothetical protein